MLILLLTGCESILPYLEEVREDPVEVMYSGTVYQGAPSGENAFLTEGSMVFSDLDGGLIAEAEQREDLPGYWQVSLPVGVAYNLRIEAPDSYPAIWRSSAPYGQAFWFSGAFFSFPHEQVDPFFDAVAEAVGVEIGDLKTDDVVHVWGRIDNPESAEPRDFPIRDGEGKRPEIYAFEELEDGTLVRTEDGPVRYVFAFDLMPGEIEVAGVTYSTEPGDLIAAWWYEVLE